MKSISLKTKIISGVITGGMILSSVSAFAANTKQTNTDALKSSGQVKSNTKRHENLETNLKKLVTDKTITQDQADKIKAATTKEEANRKTDREKTKSMTEAQCKTYMDSNKDKHVSVLKTLVANGTITQVQADKVGCGPLGSPGKHGMNMKPKSELESTLKLGITSKIITQSESDKILAYENSKTKVKTEKPNFYKELVNNKIISQAKADALKASEKVQRDTKRQQNLETSLKNLVTDKTITQDQADKIKAATIKEEAAHKAEREKTKSMTEAQRKTYMENNKANHVSPLKSLVDNGTITQAQVDKMGQGVGKHNKGNGPMEGLKIK